MKRSARKGEEGRDGDGGWGWGMGMGMGIGREDIEQSDRGHLWRKKHF